VAWKPSEPLQREMQGGSSPSLCPSVRWRPNALRRPPCSPFHVCPHWSRASLGLCFTPRPLAPDRPSGFPGPQALDQLERNFGDKHWLFVGALQNLALSYEARGDLGAARAAMDRVLALRLSMFGPRHFLYADSLFALGHMLRAVPGRAEAERAMRMMEEAVRVLEEAGGWRVWWGGWGGSEYVRYHKD
jgi:hypothetical protein